MHFKLRLIPAAATAVLLAACGGGSSSTGGFSFNPTGGVAVDGYLQFSKVICDINDDGVGTTGEPVAFTTTDGLFTFAQGCTHGLILTGGKSKDTQLLFTGQLRAPAGSKVISPATSLIAAGMTPAQVNAALNLPANTDLLTTDPAAVTAAGLLVNPELLKKTLALQQLLQKVTETFAALAGVTGSAAVEPLYNEVVAAFATSLKAGPGNLVSGTAFDPAVINAFVKAAGERVLTAATVIPSIKSAITSKGGAAILADVISDALKVQADVYLKAGDSATEIANLTKDRQINTVIADAVVRSTLSPSTTPQEIANLAALIKIEAQKLTTAPSNYLFLTDNALSLFDGTATTSFSMTQFQSQAGISVKWPMANNAALKLNLAENGSFTLASGQTLSAAVTITQEATAGAGEVKAYIDNVSVTKSGNRIQVTVPTTANAIVYGVSSDARTKAIIDFGSSVKGVTNLLSSAANAVSTIVLGDVVNFAVNGVSNDFTGINALRGKYHVSIVVTNLPLRQTDGTTFGNVTIQVPTKLDANGAATTTVPVTGPGLEGYINLTN